MLKEEKVSVSEVVDGAVGQILVDGKLHNISVETFNENALETLEKTTGAGDGNLFGIYADPEGYYDGKSSSVTFPVQVVSLNNGEYETSEETWTSPYAGDIDDIDD
ncbi:hypothetical protein JNL27_17325, partial [bacterium]|nr:hypothetical protein [bacterium]